MQHNKSIVYHAQQCSVNDTFQAEHFGGEEMLPFHHLIVLTLQTLRHLGRFATSKTHDVPQI